MQAFSRRNIFGKTFRDDVTFFTIPIWTGIFAMLLLIIMLVFATDMTYSIQTMDRFDNPKERNLQITEIR